MEDDVTRNIEEQLSAFLDGELPEEELQLLARRLEKEPAYRATLSRYALAGSVLRNDPVVPAQTGVRHSILDAVEQESEPPAVARSIPLTFGPRGAAAAAIVLGVIVLGVSQWSGVEQAPILAVNAPSEAPELSRVADVTPEVVQVAQREPEPVRAVSRRRSPVNRDRMTSYMVSHGEFSRSFHGTMVDSRIFVQQASFEE